MREDLLAYLWKTQKFRRSQLQTTSGKALVVVKPGQENQYSGPDFFNAHIQIDNTLWVGNVELHVRSSDWFHHKSDLLAQILKAKNIENFYNILDAKTSPFWERHYHFETPSKKRINRLTKSFKQLVLINSVFPFLFHYYNYGGDARKEEVLDWMRQLPPEKNNYIKRFVEINFPIEDALESQACIQL